MMVGRTWNAKIKPYCPPAGPSTRVMMSAHTVRLPSGPNTNAAPTSGVVEELFHLVAEHLEHAP